MVNKIILLAMFICTVAQVLAGVAIAAAAPDLIRAISASLMAACGAVGAAFFWLESRRLNAERVIAPDKPPAPSAAG